MRKALDSLYLLGGVLGGIAFSTVVTLVFLPCLLVELRARAAAR